MRTKSSSTARELDYSAEVLRSLPHRGAAGIPRDAALVRAGCRQTQSESFEPEEPARKPPSSPRGFCAQQDEGLLHDARNLIGAVGLYCDLLSLPQVLRPQHRHYADELRLLGERASALIEQLIERDAHMLQSALRPQGLRPIVERCAGLLRGIAEGRSIRFAYGETAMLPVRVPAESVERILINLVRNGAAAMRGMPGSIRVSVGLLSGGDGAMRPWPFQRVMLKVEDCGCGMAPETIEWLLAEHEPSVQRIPSGHGIGFRVVRELVEATDGELSVQSRRGEGTRIEIAWPVAQMPLAQMDEQAVAAAQPGFASERWRSA